MIQTVRDAESKINLLTRDLTLIKTQINELNRKVSEISLELNNLDPTETINVSDYIPSADGSSISHRVLHIFDSLRVKLLEVLDTLKVNILEAKEIFTEKLNIHKVNDKTKKWTFKTTTNSSGNENLDILNPSGSHAASFITNDGSPWNPNLTLVGNLVAHGDNLVQIGHATRRWNTVFTYVLDTQWVFATTYYVAGNPGVSETVNVILAVTPVTTVLNYITHGGSNASMNVVTGVNVTTYPMRFISGIRA